LEEKRSAGNPAEVPWLISGVELGLLTPVICKGICCSYT